MHTNMAAHTATRTNQLFENTFIFSSFVAKYSTSKATPAFVQTVSKLG